MDDINKKIIAIAFLVFMVGVIVGSGFVLATGTSESKIVSFESWPQGYADAYNDADLKFKQPLYNGSNSYLLEKDEPYKSYKLKNLSSDLFAKRTNGIDQLLIDELLCSANSCDTLNAGSICLQCDYSVVADREENAGERQ